jgi:hypothetical protein
VPAHAHASPPDLRGLHSVRVPAQQRQRRWLEEHRTRDHVHGRRSVLSLCARQARPVHRRHRALRRVRVPRLPEPALSGGSDSALAASESGNRVPGPVRRPRGPDGTASTRASGPWHACGASMNLEPRSPVQASLGRWTLVGASLLFPTFVAPGCGGATSSARDASSDSASDALVVTDDDGGSFTCGSTSTCDGRSQVCEHVQGGVANADFYACIPIPSACDTDVSCACVTSALKGRGAGQCSAAGSNLTVEIHVP